ncbi:hypothetical protein OEZ85_001722 [Tetradesmus obliquus]|uniref:Uncharacterized protein n=1 Tax=Tetradesmus obliquus TaxID=3088 RepID=A0ABY8U1C4_TETOB|nr:hypothetical protein OEZ85_001722 [Tetradesmus obliquus]
MFTSTGMREICDEAPAGAAALIPPTERRVPASTSRQDNARINARTAASIKAMAKATDSDITARITQLQWEWDVERLSQAAAAGSILGSLLLLHFVMGRPLLAALLAGGLAALLLQHALVGQSLLLPLYRGLGFRTSYEIMDELVACRLLRGDLDGLLLLPSHHGSRSTAASPAGPTESASLAAQHLEQQARQRKGEIAEIEGEEGGVGGAVAGSSGSMRRADLAERLATNVKKSGRLLGAL